MITEHAAAVLDLLRADLNLTVFDGAPPDKTDPPYVVVWVSVDGEDAHTLADVQDVARVRVTTHSVGGSGEAARIVSDRVRDALLGKRITVDGRAAWKIRRDYANPPQPDESTGRLVVDAVDVWTLATVAGG